jgi:hypothetical protein
MIRFSIAAAAVLALLLPVTSATATPVATNDQTYSVLGAVWPDPLAGCPGGPCDPNARGNVASTQFIGISELYSGLTYLNSKPEWQRFLEVMVLDGKFGEGSATKAQVEADPKTMFPGNNFAKVEFNPRPENVSAGLPTSTLERVKSDLVVGRVTDESVPDAGKKRMTLSLSIHGIERAGAEGGTRALEELVTAATTGRAKEPIVTPEVKPGAATFEEILKKTIIYFTWPNPDGWRRGSISDFGPSFQRYNGNGIDPNRDYVDIGYSYRGYSGASEPETRAFRGMYEDMLKGGIKFAAGDDLHGQPFADALSYTLLPHGRHDLGKDTRIRETAKLINRAQYESTKWSPIIQDNDQPVGGTPAGCGDGVAVGDICGKVYAQTWGSVYDTINYTTTGTLGDWFDSRTGLNADGIDNEMSFSHIDKDIRYDNQTEQLHVAGNKAIIYSHLAEIVDPLSGTWDSAGASGYVASPRVKRAESRAPGSEAPPGTQPQEAIKDELGTPGPDGRVVIPFEVKRTAQIFNGGLRVDVTAANVQGESTGVTRVRVQCKGCDDHVGAPDTENDWLTVAEDYNQSPIYRQAGVTAAVNRPDPFASDGKPVEWRAVVDSSPLGTADLPAPGPVRMNIEFSSGPASIDGSSAGDAPNVQSAYDVANTDFFKDLNRYIIDPADRFKAVDPRDVISGKFKLDSLKYLALADVYLAEGYSAGDRATWSAKLKSWVEGGGTLLLTDAALTGLTDLVGIPAEAIAPTPVYVGQVSYQRCTQYNEDGTCNGTESTVKDPLAKGVDQPAARFNGGLRRQMFEPTPLGFCIQDQAGADKSCARQYDVSGQILTSAGGRVVTSSSDSAERTAAAVVHRATVGELPLGKGKLRIAGALLPQPSQEFDHPLGVEPYALTYTGYIMLCNLLDANCQVTKGDPASAGSEGSGPGGSPAGGATACAATAGFKSTSLRTRGKSVEFRFNRFVEQPVTVEVFQTSRGRRLIRNKRVARFTKKTANFRWNGKGARGDGVYFVRYRVTGAAGKTDFRRHVIERKNGRFKRRPEFYRRASCGLVPSFKLEYPTFGGSSNRGLNIAFRVGSRAKVTVEIYRGKRRVARSSKTRARGRTHRIVLKANGLPRGDYQVRLTAKAGKRTVKATLVAKKV